MTNTKWLSALLAGTALTVASSAAMADSTFLTMTRNAAAQGVTFTVAPTADMPASATSVTISGAVGQHIESVEYAYANYDGNTDILGSFSSFNDTVFTTEADIYFAASTDTALGKVSVGANVNLESYTWSSYVGSLEFAPGAVLSGGYGGVYKADAYTAAGTYNMVGVGDAAGSREHVAVSYASGPLNFGVMVFDNGGENAIGAMIGGSFAGADLKAVVNADEDENRLAGLQAGFAVDMFSFAVAGNIGEGNPLNNDRDTEIDDGNHWTSMTATASITPVEGWTLAASYGSESNEDGDSDGGDATSDSYTISAKWAPVAQYEVIVAYNKADFESSSGDRDSDEVFGVGVWYKF